MIDSINGSQEVSHILPTDVIKLFVVNVCDELKKEEIDFSPQRIEHLVNEYIKNGKGVSRLLYSEISGQFFYYYKEGHDTQELLLNLEALINYIYTKNIEENSILVSTILRIYDHCILVVNQINAIKDIYMLSIQKTKDSIQNQVKRM